MENHIISHVFLEHVKTCFWNTWHVTFHMWHFTYQNICFYNTSRDIDMRHFTCDISHVKTFVFGALIMTFHLCKTWKCHNRDFPHVKSCGFSIRVHWFSGRNSLCMWTAKISIGYARPALHILLYWKSICTLQNELCPIAIDMFISLTPNEIMDTKEWPRKHL